MICVNCGRKIDDNSICSYCGTDYRLPEDKCNHVFDELSINEEPIDMTVNFHFKCMKCGYIEKIKTTTGLASFLRSVH